MKCLVLFFLVALAGSANAQSSLLVYQLKGEAYYQAGTKKERLKIGQPLADSNFIINNDGASIILICSNYGTVSLVQPGKYSVLQLKKLCKPPGEQGSSGYMKYMWEQLSQKGGGPESDRKRYMKNYGAVQRGCPGIEFDTWADTVRYYSGDIVLKWVIDEPHSTTDFFLYKNNKDAKALITVPCPGDSISIAQLAKRLNQVGQFYWTADITNKNSCSKKYLDIWGKDQFEKFCDDHMQYFRSLALPAAEENYILGFYLEQNKFFADALRCYKAASQLDPGNERYRQTVVSFNTSY